MTLGSIAAYRKKQTCHPSRVFGKDHDKFVQVVACRVGEPVCSDEAYDSNDPLCFIYSTIFRRLGLRLPITPFERTLMTEVNVALAQLHPNSWAFVRAFAILCYSLSLTPSVDAFLFFFEVKDPGKKLWVNFNGVAGWVLLTLFQQSYKGFKKNFFKIRSNRRDLDLLDGFPLYWTKKPNLQRPRSLEDLAPQERGVCEFHSGLLAPFNTLELLKHEFSPKSLKTYIGIPSYISPSLAVSLRFLYPALTCCLCANMGFSNNKKKKLVDLLDKRKAAATEEGTFMPIAPSTSAAPAPCPTELAPSINRPEGMVAVDTDDEETCTDLVFKRSRVDEVVAPSTSASGGLPTFMDHPPSASSPLPLAVPEGGGETVPEGQEMPSTSPLPLLLQQIFSRFQVQEVVEDLSGNLLRGCMVDVLGDLLIAFNLALYRTQEAEDLKVRVAKLEEELIAKTKAFTNCETAIYLELASLRQSEKDAKKALHDKGQEAVELEAKILPFRTHAVELEDLEMELKGKVANLEERATQREILLGQFEGELAEKIESLAGTIESFKRTEAELTNDVIDAYGEGFQDAIAQFACAHPEVDLTPFCESKCVVDGKIVPR